MNFFRFFGLSLYCLVTSAFAKPAKPIAHDPDPSFQSVYVRQTNRCFVKGSEFDVISAGLDAVMDPEEDAFGSPTLWIQPKGGKPMLAMRNDPLRNGEYAVKRVGGFDGSYCYRIPGFPLSDSVIALNFIQDARPGGVNLGIVLYDFKKEHVEKSLILGAVDENGNDALLSSDRAKALGIQSSVPAIYFRVVENRSEADEGEVTVQGHALSYLDQDVGWYKKVTWSGKDIQFDFDVDATWRLLKWASYFNSEDEFKSATGWDEAKKLPRYPMIWIADDIKNRNSLGRCYQFAAKRNELKDNLWKCERYDFKKKSKTTL